MSDFRVVTHRNWLADQFKPFGAVQDWGFDINPDTAYDTIWWAPGAWVASAAKAGVKLPLLSAGPYWLDDLPVKYRGRAVRTLSIEDSCALIGQLPDQDFFVKLPEAKLESFPARVHAFNRHWRTTISQYGLPSDTLIQLQEPRQFGPEARFFIAHGKVVADSFYKFDGPVIWGDPAFDDLKMSHRHLLSALRTYVKVLIKNVKLPPGVVIDVGCDETGAAYVIEANAAWSSSPYDADPEGVIQAVTAAHDFNDDHPQWRWKPNPVFNNVGALKVTRDG